MQFFPVVLFIMAHKVVLAFEPVYKIESKSYWAALSWVLHFMLFNVAVTFKSSKVRPFN